jgi:hypothetical protein
MYVKDKTVINRKLSITLVTLPHVLIYHFLIQTHGLNPAKDLGNLLADHTQSEITAKLSDPELSGDRLNSVTPMQSMGVTTVITTAR